MMSPIDVGGIEYFPDAAAGAQPGDHQCAGQTNDEKRRQHLDQGISGVDPRAIAQLAFPESERWQGDELSARAGCALKP